MTEFIRVRRSLMRTGTWLTRSLQKKSLREIRDLHWYHCLARYWNTGPMQLPVATLLDRLPPVEGLDVRW